MVPNTDSAGMGAARMALWSCVECTLCAHCHFLWICGVYVFQGHHTLYCISSLHTQPGIQLRIYPSSVWLTKQHTRCNRHYTCARHSRLGALCNSPIRAMGYLYKCSLSTLGFIRDNLATHHHLSQFLNTPPKAIRVSCKRYHAKEVDHHSCHNIDFTAYLGRT